MTRAAVRGAFDFSTLDPRDHWSWRRLNWILRELSSEDRKAALEAQYERWLAYLASPKFSDEQFEEIRRYASEKLTEILATIYPWQERELRESERASDRSIVDAFREKFGYPGDPRYEAMVRQTQAVFDELDRRKAARMLETTE